MRTGTPFHMRLTAYELQGKDRVVPVLNSLIGMKTWGSGHIALLFLTLTLDWGDWSA
jgi:hypothetical protein